VTGVVGHPVSNVTVAHAGSIVVQTVDATSCPGGPVIAAIPRGSHVLALARSADGTAVQVRNPANTPQKVWIGVGILKANPGQPAVSTLPVGDACPVLTVIQPAPVVVTPVTPVTPGKPKPAKDTTPPSEGKPTATFANCHTTISVIASDNVGVSSVSISWTGNNTGSGSMSPVGGHWEYTTNGFHDGNTTFAVTAHDAAGNASPTNSVTTSLQCLI